MLYFIFQFILLFLLFAVFEFEFLALSNCDEEIILDVIRM